MSGHSQGPARKFQRLGWGPTLSSLAHANLHELLLKAWRQQGDVAYVRIGPYNMTLLSDPVDVKHVLQDVPDRYGKHLSATQKLLGDGISNAEGARWRRHRMRLKTSFSHRELGLYFPLTLQNARRAVSRLQEQGSRGMDLEATVIAITQNVIFAALFGHDCPGDRHSFLRAFGDLVSNQVWLALLPPFLAGMPTPWGIAFQRAMNRINRFVMDQIRMRDRNAANADSILDQLLGARSEQGDFLFSDKDVRDDIVSLMLAGYETTAATLCWLLTLVPRHPAMYEKLRREGQELAAGNSLVYADLGRFRYGRAVVDEVLRLYPAGWSMRRIALCADTLPSGLPVFPDDFLLVSPYILHRHPDHWRHPDVFHPHRFLDRDNIRKKGYAFMPFGGGPRRCLGMNFAYMELLTVLLALLQTGGWHVAAPESIPIHSRGTMKPGIPLTLYWEA